MEIEFRLLGDIEVRIDGRSVEVGHARQRCVLAARLADANQVVPTETVVDRVWAQRPPQRARTTLSSYVTRLRHHLLASPHVAVEHRNGGYVLSVDPAAVDLFRFRTLLARARSAGDRAESAGLFAEALGLWRGGACARLDTPWIGTLRACLEADVLTKLDAS